MRVDVQPLGTFNQLAHEGAQNATSSMSQMAGIDAAVEVTEISLVDRRDIGDELGDEKTYVGVQFGFEGAMSGETVMIFEDAQSEQIVTALLPGGAASDELAQSSVEEIGNSMMSGFIGGWADYLCATIEHTPPTYIQRKGSEIMPTGPETDELDQFFVLRSEITWDDEEDAVEFYLYMLPEYELLVRLMADHGKTSDGAISIEELAVFNQMTREGTRKAAENVELLSGFETKAEVSQIFFSPIEDVPRQFDDEMYVGTAVQFTGTPSGFLLVLFDETSAMNVAEALVPGARDADGLTDQYKAAIEELGNSMTSGFVDGWANVLQQPIDHTPPRLVHDMGRAMIDPLVAQLGQKQRHAFIIGSRMVTDDVAFQSEIHALPNESELRSALEDLDVERADETEADAERLF